MSETVKEKTLLQSLLDCFSASKTMIEYVFEREVNGQKRYELPLTNVVDWWKIIFSKDIVSLSIAPRSHDKQINKDTLSAFVRSIVNDKNKSVVEKNIIPHLEGTRCIDIISGEVSHLEHTIDLGVRAKYSPWVSSSDRLSSEEMKASEEVRIHYDDAVRFLMQLFCGEPYDILLNKYAWLAECIDASELNVEHYSTNQILSVFACALILCLNITEVPEINNNITTYIKSVIVQSDNASEKINSDTMAEPILETNSPTSIRASFSQSQTNKSTKFGLSDKKELSYLRKVEYAKRVMNELEEALNLLRLSKNESEFRKARFGIISAIRKIPQYAEIILNELVNEDDESQDDRSKYDLSKRLQDKLTILVDRYIKLIEKDQSEIEEIDDELISLKWDLLEEAVKGWHITVACLEVTLKREQELLQLANSEIQKENLKKDIRHIRDEYDFYVEGTKEIDIRIDDEIDTYRRGKYTDMSSM